MSISNPVVIIRVSRAERELLEAGAELARTNLNDFNRRKALEAAEMDMLDHRIVTIPGANWEAFENWVNAPAKVVPALKKLADSRPALES